MRISVSEYKKMGREGFMDAMLAELEDAAPAGRIPIR